jgi:hypothetical protein
MKNYLLLLSFFLVSLLGAKGIESSLPSDEGVGVETVLSAEASVGYILPLVAELPDTGEAYVDVESMAGQYRVVGRGQRSFSVQQMFMAKSSAYRAARRRLEMLSHTINQVYTSLPCQSWAVSSDHYVFGMRRILI